MLYLIFKRINFYAYLSSRSFIFETILLILDFIYFLSFGGICSLDCPCFLICIIIVCISFILSSVLTDKCLQSWSYKDIILYYILKVLSVPFICKSTIQQEGIFLLLCEVEHKIFSYGYMFKKLCLPFHYFPAGLLFHRSNIHVSVGLPLNSIPFHFY